MAKSRASKPITEGGDAIPASIKPAELAERLRDPEFRERIEAAVTQLPPDKAAELVVLLEASIRRRKVELIGYVTAAMVLLIGMVIALYAFGAADQDQFVGWVFLAPLAAAGVILIAVARWSAKREAQDRARGRAPGPPRDGA